MPPQPPPLPPADHLIHVEFRLDWLIRLADLERATPDRRLNAIQNLLAGLSRPWRGNAGPISPARDVRLSSATYEAFSAWVEMREMAVGKAAERLAAYAAGADGEEIVPDGWLRLLNR